MLEGLNDQFTPLYLQLKNHLNHLIDGGSVRPGDRLPSEKELETRFRVSRITVRRALQELVAEEKILRIPGKGSFILPKKVEPLTALTSFSENMRAQGFVPSYRDTSVRLIKPPTRVSAFLGVEPDSKVLNITRVLLADDVPMALQEAFLPSSFYETYPRLFTVDFLNHFSMYDALELNMGIKLIRAEEFVDASQATASEAEQLDIKRGDEVLVITRMTYSDNDRPVEFVKLVFRADRYRYRVELFRPSKRA